MLFGQLRIDDEFRFAMGAATWIYRGNGWYGWPYSGGPYHECDKSRGVEIIRRPPASHVGEYNGPQQIHQEN